MPSATLWTQRGGDAGHTSYVDVSVNAAGITPAWSQTISYGSSGDWAQHGNRGVAIDGTRLYRTELEGYWASGNYHVMAYDLQTGVPLWNRVILGNGSVSAPSVGNGYLYVNRSGHSGISGGTSDELPYLAMLDPQTGATVRTANYGAQWNSDERPVLDGNQVIDYDGYYGGISSWNTSTLAKQWNRQGWQNVPLTVALDSQYVYAFNNMVFDRATGANVRTVTGPASYPWVKDPMVSASGKVLYEVRNDQYYPSQYALAAYSAGAATSLWTAVLPGYPQGEAVGNGVVAVTAGGKLTVLDEATGTQLLSWTAPNPFGSFLSEQVVLTRTHAFVEVDGARYGPSTVYAVNLATGQADWSYTNALSDENWETDMEIAIGGDFLILSHDGFIKAFNLAEVQNTPPSAVDDIATATEDHATTINVLANDSDADGDTLTISAVGRASHGQVVLNADQTITYTPTANFNGTDSFTYTVSDGRGGTDTATVSIAVSAVNDVPVASSWQFGTDEDTPLSSTLRGSDVDGDPLQFVLVSGPTHGTVEIDASTGAFTYTPEANYGGSDKFTFRVYDGTAYSTVAMIFISVRPVPDPPVAVTDPAVSGDEAAAITFDGSGSYDVDGDSLTYLWEFGDGATGTGITATHVYADSGIYNARLTVNDGHGNSDSQAVVVTVANVVPTTEATGPQTGVRGQTRTFSLTASDASSVDQASPFTYLINWGDGSAVESVSGSASLSVDHVFLNAGSFTVSATAIDKDNGAGVPATVPLTISAAEMQGQTLAIGGTTSADNILVTALNSAGDLGVTINGSAQQIFHPTGSIIVYAQGGNDVVEIRSQKVKGATLSVAVSAFLFGENGDDSLIASGSTANNVLVGGNGADSLLGGGSRDLLIGSLGADGLRGGSDDDILIGGATEYDEDLAALKAMLTEWSRTDLGYQERIDHLSGVTAGGLNGAYQLDSSTVQDDGAVDELSGEGGRDWFLLDTAGPSADVITDWKRNETVTSIP